MKSTLQNLGSSSDWSRQSYFPSHCRHPTMHIPLSHWNLCKSLPSRVFLPAKSMMQLTAWWDTNVWKKNQVTDKSFRNAHFFHFRECNFPHSLTFMMVSDHFLLTNLHFFLSVQPFKDRSALKNRGLPFRVNSKRSKLFLEMDPLPHKRGAMTTLN